MSKIWFVIVIVFIFTGCQKCKLERENIEIIANPIIKAMFDFAKNNGIPKSIEEIKNFPYKIKSCSKNVEDKRCKKLGYSHFFLKDNKYYAIKISYLPNAKSAKGFGIFILYNTTKCYQKVYDKNSMSKKYSLTCSLNCETWFRQ